jgi:hypothetical protein
MAVDPVTMMTVANALGGNQQGGGLSSIVQGAASGAMIANPAAGAAMAGLGLFQTIKGNRMRKKADALQPQAEDPEQRLRLARLKRRRDELENKGFQTVNEQLQNLQKQTVVNIRRMGGGSGASIAGAAKSAKGIAEIMGKLGVQARGMAEQVDTKVGAATDMIAQRKLELQLLRQSKLEARAEQLRKAGGQNLAAGVAAIAKGGDKMNFGDSNFKDFTFGKQAFEFGGDGSALPDFDTFA